jgi:hypothetical protein
MFWKDQLASEILAQSQCTYDWLLGLRSRFPQLRVKTVDARGTVPVIRFDDRNGEWLKPKEWAENHRQSVSCKFQEWHSRMLDLGYDLSNLYSNGAQSNTSGTNQGGDNAEVDILRQQNRKLIRHYKWAMSLLKKVSAGETLDSESEIKIAKYDESRPSFVLR